MSARVSTDALGARADGGNGIRILFLTDNFPPEVNAPASRTYEHALRWVRAGAKVSIITCAPNFPRGRVFDGYRNRLYAREAIDGIEVIRVWSFIAPNSGFAKRVADYLSFAVASFIAGLFQKADVIVATSPQFFTTWSGAALAFLKRRPWIFELRDIWPESIGAVGAAGGGRTMRLLERIELLLYRSANRIVAVSPAFRDNLAARGIDPTKIDIVTNGADLSLWQPRPTDNALRSELGLIGKFVIGYIGTMGMAHGLDFILSAAEQIEDRRIHFLLVGDGSEASALRQRVAAAQLGNVTIHPPVPKEEAPRFLAASDVALVPLRRTETFRSVIPSKIFEAAAMRRPILLGVEGQAAEIVESHVAGIAFTPEDMPSLLSAIRRIASDENLYARLQQGCAGLAIEYDRDRLAAKMLNILKAVAA